AAHEIAHEAAASDLRQGTCEGIADHDIDPRDWRSGPSRIGGRQPIIDTARGARAAPAIAAMALDDLAVLCRHRLDRAPPGEACRNRADPGFEPAGNELPFRRAVEDGAGH